jgi:hypothetical protein
LHAVASDAIPAGRGGEGRDRTGDTAIFSRVLYQLSYLALRPGTIPTAGGPPPRIGEMNAQARYDRRHNCRAQTAEIPQNTGENLVFAGIFRDLC